jgi:GTP-binding protein HflX
LYDNQHKQQLAVIAGVNLNDDPDFDYSMIELAQLVAADNLTVAGKSTQNSDTLVAATYFGLGKVNEIKALAQGLKAKLLVVNSELTPMQIRNLENFTHLRVIDRTELILEIFSRRARTKQAKLQVELARLEYELPRLHPSERKLDQQRGGGFANRGSGESKLELNRRTINKRIDSIKAQLKNIAEQEDIKSKRRNQSRLPQVALVGYTNAGKSTTMNGLLAAFSNTKQHKPVFEKNMLFATLDTSVRRIDYDQNLSFILSDTVGFISHLPHNLVEAFKATLQEAKSADLLVNVVDASDPNMLQMIRTTKEVLAEIGINNTPMITAYNKADLTKRRYPEIEGSDILYSAQDPASQQALAKLIIKRIFASYERTQLWLPLTAGKDVAYLHEYGEVEQEEYLDDGIKITARIAPQDQERFKKYWLSKH